MLTRTRLKRYFSFLCLVFLLLCQQKVGFSWIEVSHWILADLYLIWWQTKCISSKFPILTLLWRLNIRVWCVSIQRLFSYWSIQRFIGLASHLMTNNIYFFQIPNIALLWRLNIRVWWVRFRDWACRFWHQIALYISPSPHIQCKPTQCKEMQYNGTESSGPKLLVGFMLQDFSTSFDILYWFLCTFSLSR